MNTTTTPAFLSAEAAAAELGVSMATLYAYVSRGMIRSEPVPGQRRKRYSAQDVRAVKRGRGPDAGSVGAPVIAPGQPLAWGLPVMDSAITLIADGGLYYRGVSAVDLAQGAGLEEVASLLWGVKDDPFDQSADPYPSLPPLPENLDFAERAMALLAIAQASDPAAFTSGASALAATGGRIVRLLTMIAARRPWSAASVHEVLADAWAPNRIGAARLTRAALVLLADHELNVSAFTLRCAISARAPLHSAIAAALAALQGPRHGGMVTKAGRLIDEIALDEDPERTIDALKRRLKRGDDLPGFGHPLYPNGDIRAKTLIDLMNKIMPQDRDLKCARVLTDAVAQASGERPNIDFSLAILGRTLGFPDGFGVALFAVARAAGWIAHAIEQSAQPELIRPRARYTGPLPQS
jgi:citrate synthase